MSRFDWYSISEVINDFRPQTSGNDHMLTARALIFFNQSVYVNNWLI